jgi:hypothetical protein
MGHVNKLIQHRDIDMTFNIETRRTFIENEVRGCCEDTQLAAYC